MAKLNENEKGFRAFVVIIIVVVMLSFWSSYRNDYVEKNGVYTILTVDKINAGASGGLATGFHYFYMGQRYKGGINLSFYTLGINEVGARFLLMLIPSDPKNYLVVSRVRVPSWFTLDAPPEGWATEPTLADLRKLMVSDSISRGLKVADTLSKE